MQTVTAGSGRHYAVRQSGEQCRSFAVAAAPGRKRNDSLADPGVAVGIVYRRDPSRRQYRDEKGGGEEVTLREPVCPDRGIRRCSRDQ